MTFMVFVVKTRDCEDNVAAARGAVTGGGVGGGRTKRALFPFRASLRADFVVAVVVVTVVIIIAISIVVVAYIHENNFATSHDVICTWRWRWQWRMRRRRHQHRRRLRAF